ncbi:exosortase A [Sphingorhabdus sp.]|jgi:exosortase A|uniref:exosortase A n=1 Tax=Sphingorhabdus sp. TaxID=1902408 RepID=UPI0035B34FD3|nr:exosortase A [Sphingomonadaceae bacterium]
MTANWRAALLRLAMAWAALLALFWRDAADMAAIWWNSSTFNHCLLIIPILWWLVDQRKGELARLEPRCWALPLLWIAAAAFGWLLGAAGGVALARHAGLVMLLQGSVALLLGPAVTRGLLFPLFYMFFLVPFGEEFVPALQTITAEMCMWLLGLTGIPAHIDGIYIATPTALFRVAEACSGVKFLVAMVALGALVSNLCFNSWPRRIAFMAACVVIPILANGLRAFGTIYIAHHGNLDFAASFDHVVFGWVFFGIVIALVMAAGWRFFDRAADAQAIDADRLKAMSGRPLKPGVAAAALAAITILPVGWSSIIASRASPVPAQIDLPAIDGWSRVDYRPAVAWKPHFAGASHTLLGRYRNAQGQEVDLFVAVYDRQSEGRELVGFGQGAAGGSGHWSWIEGCDPPASGRCERIATKDQHHREVVSFYRVNGTTSGSGSAIKLATLKAKLLGGNQQAVAILVSAEQQRRENPRPAIDSFLKSIRTVDKLADHMAGLD